MILMFLKCLLALILLLTLGNENYEYSGIIGECEDYDAYKAALDARREKIRLLYTPAQWQRKEVVQTES